MEPLRLYKIEAIIVDDQLSKEEVAKRLGSFVIKLDLAEIDPLMGYTKFIDAKPAQAAKPKKASTRKKATKKITQRRAARLQPQTLARVEQVIKAIGRDSLTIKEIAQKAKMPFDLCAYVVEQGERNRMLAIKMEPNKGTRPIRKVSVIK